MTTGPPVSAQLPAAEMAAQWQPLLGDDPWSQALMAAGVGITCLWNGEVERAERQLAAALDQFRALGERWGTIMALSTMAELADWHGMVVPLAPMDEALRLAEELGSIVDLADLLRGRGDGRVRAGDLDGARADYERAVEFARRAGAPEMLAAARLGLDEVALLRGDLDLAGRLCRSALAECPIGWFAAEATRFGILVTLGRVAEQAGDSEDARVWYGRALTTTPGARRVANLSDAIKGLVGIALRDGDRERAALLLGAATALLTDPAAAAEVTRVAAALRERIGDPAYGKGVDRGAALTREQALAVLSGRL